VAACSVSAASIGDGTPCFSISAATGASAVTGTSWPAEGDTPAPERSMVRTVRGANGLET